jgi:hypothetical protein
VADFFLILRPSAFSAGKIFFTNLSNGVRNLSPAAAVVSSYAQFLDFVQKERPA